MLNLPVISYGATALVPFSKEVEALLTQEDRFGQSYKMYEHESGNPYIRVPRGLADFKQVQHDHTVVNPVLQSVALKPPRNGDQASCITRSTALLLDRQDHIVEAPTGFGKTYVGCSVANNVGQATLIVVTKNDLVKGWKDTFLNLMGYSPSEIGHVQQDKCVYKGCRVVVAMVHSLICREYPPDFYQYFGLVIFDEVHRLGAEYFAQACKLFPSRHRLGLSATPKRSDGREKLFHAHIGPVLVRGEWIPMSPKVLVKRTGWKVPKVPRRDPETGAWKSMPMEVVPGRMMAVTKAMAADPGRNTEIASFVAQAFEAGRWVLVLSELNEGHLQVLFHYIVKAGVGGEHMAYYTGSVTKSDLEIAKTKRVVLATYAMTSEGTDVPHWDTLVMATPRSNAKQPVGRVLRYMEGKRTPVILELLDDHPVLQAFYYSRLKQYYSLKSEIVEV